MARVGLGRRRTDVGTAVIRAPSSLLWEQVSDQLTHCFQGKGLDDEGHEMQRVRARRYLSPEPARARVHVEPDVPAIAATVGQDDPLCALDTTPFLRRAVRGRGDQPIGERQQRSSPGRQAISSTRAIASAICSSVSSGIMRVVNLDGNLVPT